MRIADNIKKTPRYDNAAVVKRTFASKQGDKSPPGVTAPMPNVAHATRDVRVQKPVNKEQTQKRREEAILTAITHAALLVGKDQRIALANPAFYETFRVTGEEVLNRPITQVISVKDLPEMLTRLLAHESSPHIFGYKHNLDGRDIVLIAGMTLLEKGKALIVFNDVTEQRERQERLYLTDRLASINEILSDTSHDLNNALSSILGLSELLLEGDIADVAREDITAIYGEASRASRTVKELSAFSHKHLPIRQNCQVNNILDEILRSRADEHTVNKIKVIKRFATKLPEIMIDYFQLQQAFLNIINNLERAIIETHRRRTITITTKKANGYIRVSFSDDGLSINHENTSRIFDPFFTTKELGKGAGLFLNICSEIVTANNGRVTVDGDHGAEPNLIVELPLEDVSCGVCGEEKTSELYMMNNSLRLGK